MADKQSDTYPPFDPIAYAEEIAQHAAGKDKKVKPKKRLDQPGEEGVFLTKPYTVVKNDAGFEMKGQGAIDARLTGPRPKRPDRIIQDNKEDENRPK